MLIKKMNENSKLCVGDSCILISSNGLWKSYDCFPFSNRSYDGYQSVCKQCKLYTRIEKYENKKFVNCKKIKKPGNKKLLQEMLLFYSKNLLIE